MTRDKLINAITDDGRDTISPVWGGEIAERVLAAINEDRGEEAVLGEFTGGVDVDVFLRQAHSSRKPIKIATLCSAGKIIFRQQEKKP